MNTKELIRKLEQMTELSESRNEFYKKLIHSFQNDADPQIYDKIYSRVYQKMRKQKYKEQECRRRYYFFDYLFWLGEITWENYHKVNFKQPRGSDMLWACITFFIFMPALTIAGHFLDDLAFEVFGVILVILFSVSVIMTDRLFGKIYLPSRRKAVMQHYAGRKFSPFRRNLFFFSLYLLIIPAMVLLGTALKWITEILK